MVNVSHKQLIPSSFYQVVSTVSLTKALPKWVGFFKECINEKGQFCRFITPIGESVTTTRLNVLESERADFTIHSKFRESRIKEKADITIYKIGESLSDVLMTLYLPDHFTQDKVEMMKNGLSMNLNKLGDICREI